MTQLKRDAQSQANAIDPFTGKPEIRESTSPADPTAAVQSIATSLVPSPASVRVTSKQQGGDKYKQGGEN